MEVEGSLLSRDTSGKQLALLVQAGVTSLASACVGEAGLVVSGARGKVRAGAGTGAGASSSSTSHSFRFGIALLGMDTRARG